MNCPYFHVLAGLGFSFLQFGHLAIIIPCCVFVCMSLKRFMVCWVVYGYFSETETMEHYLSAEAEAAW